MVYAGERIIKEKSVNRGNVTLILLKYYYYIYILSNLIKNVLCHFLSIELNI